MARSFFERLTGSVRVTPEEKGVKEVPEIVRKPSKIKESKPRKRGFGLGKLGIEPQPKVESIYPVEEEKGEEDVPPARFEAPAVEAGAGESEEGELMLDVYDEGSHFVVQSTVAGVRPEDIDISVEDGTLTVRGERRRAHEERDKNYYVKELYWGKFSRSVVLPEEVDADRVEASLKDGLLIVKVPKKYKGEKKIKVKVE